MLHGLTVICRQINAFYFLLSVFPLIDDACNFRDKIVKVVVYPIGPECSGVLREGCSDYNFYNYYAIVIIMMITLYRHSGNL